jgi:tetratricopeptide (TPR) repeat protein
LWWKRESFYGPQDFQDEKHFVGLLKKMTEKVENLEIRQEATQIDAGADIHEFTQTIERLSGKGDIYTAIIVGRIPLKEGRYDSSYEVFKYLEEHVPKSDQLYSRILANLAYSLVGLKEYGKAIDKLKEVYELRDEKRFYAWHAIALAYSYFKLNEDKEYRKWLNYAKNRAEYSRNLFLMEKLYPEIAKDL